MYDLNIGKTIYKQAKQNICIIGAYGNGKGTLLNCLTGRQIRSSITPEFALIPYQVIYGPDDGMARVSWRDHSRTEMVIPDRLLKKLIRDPNYESDIQEQAIESVTLTSETMDPRFCYRIMPSGLDTDWVTLDTAGAIVFVAHAGRLGTSYEVDFIKSHFAGRGLRNVFFVINWYNILREEDKEGFHKELKRLLSPVFTDASGYFDEALYNQRVFPVDAYTSECARTGIPRSLFKFKVPVVPEEDAYTGVPEFERALYRFLGLKYRKRE